MMDIDLDRIETLAKATSYSLDPDTIELGNVCHALIERVRQAEARASLSADLWRSINAETKQQIGRLVELFDGVVEDAARRRECLVGDDPYMRPVVEVGAAAVVDVLVERIESLQAREKAARIEGLKEGYQIAADGVLGYHTRPRAFEIFVNRLRELGGEP